MSPVTRTLRGIAAMIASQLAFLLNDTLIKLSGDALPMGEIIFVRGVVSTLLVGVAAVMLGLHRYVPRAFHRSVTWRIVGEIGAAYFYILALLHMPIANTTIIFRLRRSPPRRARRSSSGNTSAGGVGRRSRSASSASSWCCGRASPASTPMGWWCCSPCYASPSATSGPAPCPPAFPRSW
jgi:hypothetical protein